MTLKVTLADSVTAVDAESWDALVGGMPLLNHAFLSALETSNSVGKGTGWQSCPMLVFDGEAIVGALPLYVIATPTVSMSLTGHGLRPTKKMA